MLKRIFKLIFVIALIPFAVYLWPSALGGSAGFLIVQGKSMLPTILPGSLVVTKQAESYNIDEIVAYDAGEDLGHKVIVHRILDITDDGSYIIKGDNNPVKDFGFPTQDQILGKVIFSTPYVGDLVGMLRNPIVLIVAGGVIAVIQNQNKNRKKKKERLRQIRLGISPSSITQEQKAEKTKPKKPDYTLFILAIGFNVFTYVSHLVLISSDKIVTGDFLTGFMYKILSPYLASTISFALYFVLILGLYFAAKYFEIRKKQRLMLYGDTPKKKKSTISLLIGRETHPMLAVSSLGWLLFIIMSIFYLIGIVKDLATIMN